MVQLQILALGLLLNCPRDWVMSLIFFLSIGPALIHKGPIIPTKCKQYFFHQHMGLKRCTSVVEVDPSGEPGRGSWAQMVFEIAY